MPKTIEITQMFFKDEWKNKLGKFTQWNTTQQKKKQTIGKCNKSR